MFEFASKLLPTLAYPLGSASLLIIISAFVFRQEKLQRGMLILAFALLWFGGNRWAAAGLARSLERQYPAPDPIPTVEALVVLGGGTDPLEPPREMVEINGAGDRVFYAAQLYREGKARHILVSGGRLDWDSCPTTPAGEMASLLTWMGVPGEAIWIQDKSRNTYEDVLYSTRMLREMQVEKILLVTSAWHMPRAMMLFEAQGIEAFPAPTDYNVTDVGWERLWRGDPRSFVLDLFPEARYLSLTTRMLKEHLGLWIYRLRGWI